MSKAEAKKRRLGALEHDRTRRSTRPPLGNVPIRWIFFIQATIFKVHDKCVTLVLLEYLEGLEEDEGCALKNPRS